MKKRNSYSYLLMLSLWLFVSGCYYHDLDQGNTRPSGNYFIFGSFYHAMCVGNCDYFYLINDGSLYAIDKTEFHGQGSLYDFEDLTKLSAEKYDLVKNIPQTLPAELLNESQTIIGCPDCADGGGVYLETKINGKRRFWFIDNMKSQTPSYLHALIDNVNEKVRLLRNS